KIVEVRAFVRGGRYLTLSEAASQKSQPCAAFMNVGLEFPENVQPNAAFNLEDDNSLKSLRDGLEKGQAGIATLKGRFDPVFTWKGGKRLRVGEGEGFGPKHLNDARLVLKSVSDVLTIPISRPR